jgi:protein involved in polysaccharide export with SLBB domain
MIGWPISHLLTFVRSNLKDFLLLAFVVLSLPEPRVFGQTDDRSRPVAGTVGEQIHYGDLVEVDVIGSLDFDWRGGLTPEGFLDGLERAESAVYALCRTEGEVANAVADRYRKILRDPNVVVRIIDRSNRALAYISGAVKIPQRFQLRRPVTLTELIVLSGGVTDASNGEISVFRPPYVNCRQERYPEPAFENAATQTPKRFSIKIADLLNGERSANLLILSGDIVSVLEAAPIFVMLDAGTARRMNLTPDLTLLRAITSAGGLFKDLDGKKIRIYRRNTLSPPLDLDFRRIYENKDEAPKLMPFDVIMVQKKGGEESRPADMGWPAGNETDKLAKLPLRIVD